MSTHDPALAIDIAVEHDAWSILGDVENRVARAADAVLSICGRTVADGAELSLVLCDDAFIRALNRNWRGKDEATNVLSFPTEASAHDRALGDIVIAYETSAREAVDEGRSLADHFVHLVVHGLFHLLGFDHETEAEADVMETLESRSLIALGIASPYLDLPPVDAEDRRAPS